LNETSAGLGADLLWGVERIADFLGTSKRRTFYLLERGYVPAQKCGRLWVARRSALNAHFQQLCGGNADGR